jgi:ankyrin repeat protein
LRYASRNGHINVVKMLIDAKADIHAKDDYSLRVASYKGHATVVQMLINAKADIHSRD